MARPSICRWHHRGLNRGTITKADGSTVQMDHYEVLGTKYVPVRVATSDLADFCSKYTVVENGGQLVGGYSEKNLTAYALTAAVDKNTNGLKYATKSGDGYTFSAAHTGTGSGVAEAAQKAAEGLTVNLRSGSDVGSFGEFIRVDLNGNYGELGSRMQSVVWTYYGNDSTYTHAKASYGTKFAADNWMHKSMGIQLGLSDSARCQLPEGTDGTGYWTITIRALATPIRWSSSRPLPRTLPSTSWQAMPTAPPCRLWSPKHRARQRPLTPPTAMPIWRPSWPRAWSF